MFQTSGLMYGILATNTFSTGDNFTQIFHTRGFMGNAEILTKFNFVAGLVSDVISICGFIGVSLVVIRLMISLLYKSNPVLFDEIDEIKQSNTWSGGDGVKGIAGGTVKFLLGSSLNGVKNKSGGGIIDTIIWFVLGAMPNVKHYSDFADGGDEKLKDMSTTQYLLKVSPKIIMQVFFFSIAWNGVLFQAYGSVVDAMGVAAERVVTDDLAVAVENALDTGKKYTFTFKNNGTDFGIFQQRVAEDMYSKSCKKMSKSTRTQENYYEVGTALQGLVAGMPQDNVQQIGAARSASFNLETTKAKETFLKAETWDNNVGSTNPYKDKITTEKPDNVESDTEVLGTFKDGKQENTVYVLKDKSGAVIGYKYKGVQKVKYIEMAASNVSVSSNVWDHLQISSYTTNALPAGVEVNKWQMDDGMLRVAYDLTSCGGNSNVAWVITSEATPQLYVVCSISYTDGGGGSQNFEIVSGRNNSTEATSKQGGTSETK